MEPLRNKFIFRSETPVGLLLQPSRPASRFWANIVKTTREVQYHGNEWPGVSARNETSSF
ncbi:hypothetical protein FP2506_12344 [Fulvimarina pelagi HTCC2506]|uniref:Uncharacterized protein n=1 Tax=Fulvimarina pelagi HTCC2506 TaxID=314231 RepID=Q0G1M7_9HYPH|nr:hypothetical protein FP2506_12344 [Fulvimarina pelagi HTCC2506]